MNATQSPSNIFTFKSRVVYNTTHSHPLVGVMLHFIIILGIFPKAMQLSHNTFYATGFHCTPMIKLIFHIPSLF